MVLATGADVVSGTWRTALFCLGVPAKPGFAEIPRGDRSPARVALWGVLTGEAPDEYPVDVDGERGVLIVHVLDSSDPDAVRARHARADERWQRKVVS
jgi:multisubunit Na+/H+ antiporter MnhE subunit